MSDVKQAGGVWPPDVVERATHLIALAGGLLSLLIAVVVVVSVFLRWANIGSVPGDFELVQMGTALTVFCFLPYCQIRRGNIMVDTFTSRLPARLNAWIDAFWDLVYAVLMLILAISLVAGAQDVIRSGQNTMVLGLPLWPAIVAAAALTFVLAFVTLISARRLLRPSS